MKVLLPCCSVSFLCSPVLPLISCLMYWWFSFTDSQLLSVKRWTSHFLHLVFRVSASPLLLTDDDPVGCILYSGAGIDVGPFLLLFFWYSLETSPPGRACLPSDVRFERINPHLFYFDMPSPSQTHQQSRPSPPSCPGSETPGGETIFRSTAVTVSHHSREPAWPFSSLISQPQWLDELQNNHSGVSLHANRHLQQQHFSLVMIHSLIFPAFHPT